MELKFEWDRRKAAANLAAHGVRFEEAITAFADPLARLFDDEDHSIEERREILIGHSIEKQLLIVCFVQRANTVRIISARKTTRRERKDYEEDTKA